MRERLHVIRAEEEARYERARIERQHLTRVERPPIIEQALASAQKDIQTRTSEATQLTPAERAQPCAESSALCVGVVNLFRWIARVA